MNENSSQCRSQLSTGKLCEMIKTMGVSLHPGRYVFKWRCVLPLAVAGVRSAAPSGDPGSTRGEEEPTLPRSPPLALLYEAASLTHRAASLGSKLPTTVWTNKDRTHMSQTHVVKNVLIYVKMSTAYYTLCVFKMTCGKGPCLNLGHCYGGL